MEFMFHCGGRNQPGKRRLRGSVYLKISSKIKRCALVNEVLFGLCRLANILGVNYAPKVLVQIFFEIVRVLFRYSLNPTKDELHLRGVTV
jgi:hypothetical protein